MVWACNANKSPDPDGFSFGFIKEYWELLKTEKKGMMLEFHRNGKFVRGMNPSIIVLIPKSECSHSMNDFRPISLMGCLYKIISKTLAARLSKVIEALIWNTQYAFLLGRQILDGIVI